MGDIAKSLAEYSPTVNTTAEAVSQALLPIASLLILTFFLTDMLSWNKRLGQEGGSLTVQLLMEVALGYVIAFILVQFSDQIFDLIVFVFNGAVKLVDKLLPGKDFKTDMDTTGVSGWLIKQVVQLVAKFVQFIGDVCSSMLVFMRFFQMYVLKAIAPILIAFFMSEQTRQVALNFMKHFAAYAFQGLLLLVIIKLYPALVTDDLFKGASGDLAVAFTSIAKGIMYIACLFGSQKLAKSLLNVS